MKKFLKITGFIILGLFILIVGLGLYAYTMKPDVGDAPDIKINATPEMIERGRYLANGFAACMECHSEKDMSKFAGPIIPGTEGKGGMDFGEGAGKIFAKNITSDKETGVGSWTDGELFRAITMGVDKNGEPLGPMMPYMYYRTMDEEDIKAIIAYIRTLAPIKNAVPQHELNFPVNLIFRMLPDKPAFVKLPGDAEKIKLGEYYSGSCFACHTPKGSSGPDTEKMFSGGVEYPLPDGSIVRSPNITPDKETGIGNWTKQQFIDRFKFYAKPENKNVSVKHGEFNTVMPWLLFAGLKDEDLGNVYDYLMTQKPIKNTVVKFSPPGTTGPQAEK
jgi:mono/diheme cytochrome c family protein